MALAPCHCSRPLPANPQCQSDNDCAIVQPLKMAWTNATLTACPADIPYEEEDAMSLHSGDIEGVLEEPQDFEEGAAP